MPYPAGRRLLRLDAGQGLTPAEEAVQVIGSQANDATLAMCRAAPRSSTPVRQVHPSVPTSQPATRDLPGVPSGKKSPTRGSNMQERRWPAPVLADDRLPWPP